MCYRPIPNGFPEAPLGDSIQLADDEKKHPAPALPVQPALVLESTPANAEIFLRTLNAPPQCSVAALSSRNARLSQAATNTITAVVSEPRTRAENR